MPLDRVVDDTDGVLTYRGSWTSLSGSTRQWGGNVHVTTSVGSSVSFQFQGFILRIFHTIPNGEGEVQVDISIDGGGPIRVTRTAGSEPVYADLLYETTSLSDFATHTVLITYRGNSANAPFSFDRVQLESDQGIPNVSSWAPGSGPVNPGTTTTPTNPNPPTTTIGGGGGGSGGGNNGGGGGSNGGGDGGSSGGGNNGGTNNGGSGGSGAGNSSGSGGGSSGGGSQNGNGSGNGQTSGSGSNVRPTITTDADSTSSSRTGTSTSSPGTTGTGTGQAQGGSVSTLLHTQTDTVHSTATNGLLGDQSAASERIGPPIGPIVGGVLGFVVILALVVFFLVRRAKRRRQGHSPLEEDPAMVENAKPRNPVIPVPFALDITPREESASHTDPRSATLSSEKAMRFHQDLQLLEAARRMEEQGLGGTMLTTTSGTSVSGTSSVLPLTAAAGAIAGSTVGGSMSMYHSTDEEGGPVRRAPAESSASPGKLSQEYSRSVSPGYTTVSGAATTDGDVPPAYAPRESRHSRTLSPDSAGPSGVSNAQ